MAAAELSPCRTHVSIGVSNQDRKTSFNYLADTYVQGGYIFCQNAMLSGNQANFLCVTCVSLELIEQ